MIQINLQNGKLNDEMTNLLNRAVETSLPAIAGQKATMEWEVRKKRKGCKVVGRSDDRAVSADVALVPLDDAPDGTYGLDSISYTWMGEDQALCTESWTPTPLSEFAITNVPVEEPEPDDDEDEERIEDDDENEDDEALVEDDDEVGGWFVDMLYEAVSPMSRVEFCQAMSAHVFRIKRGLIKCFQDQGVTIMRGNGDPLFASLSLVNGEHLVAEYYTGEQRLFDDLPFGHMMYLADEIL